MRFLLLVFLGLSGFCVKAKAQQAILSEEIAEQFSMQYPYATALSCKKQAATTTIDFLMKNEKYHAVYKNNVWVYTWMHYTYQRLPEKVKERVKRSRMAALPLEHVRVIYIPSGFEAYQLQFSNGSGGKKFRYFSESGREIHNRSFEEQ